MKKILSTSLAIGLLVSTTGTVYAQVNEGIKNQKMEQKVRQNEGELFIGLIEGVENGKVKVKGIFDITGKINKDSDVYIDLSGAEGKENVSEYPEGYIISIYYDEVDITEGVTIIKANKLSAVEANGEVSTCEPVAKPITMMPVKNKEVTTMPVKEERELVIGVIEDYSKDTNRVQIKPIFDLTDRLYGEKIFLDITDAEYRDGKIEEFPNGYLISVYYNDIEEKDGEIVVKAEFVSAVEEDQEVTINETLIKTEDKKDVEVKPITIMPVKSKEATTMDVKEAEVESNEGESFWSKAINFITNLFSFL